ncbi:hypothetical protein [Schleiferilactobacillus harbinensis]|uniref:Uncharacterized protein n=1 Tax=Schleiferilactobacillus harbinensis TaxID=304207 RepID=A0A5P8M3Q5_9LACO|nr:hypothetical protein [Schleiferilactobacillus harbinensis]QFR23120.1 hypothetical protein D1010_06715 [Schleiferilactobacillus harbinensis]
MIEFKDWRRAFAGDWELVKLMTPKGQVWPVETILWQGRKQLIGSWDGGDYVNFSLNKPLNQLKNGLVLYADPAVKTASSASFLAKDGGVYLPNGSLGGYFQVEIYFGTAGQATMAIDHPSGQSTLRLYVPETVRNGPLYATKMVEY